MRSIPSPSSMHELGRADGVDADHVRAVGRQRGEVAPGEGLHALHERLLAAGGDQQDTRTPRDRLSRRRRATPSERGHAREVVVGARGRPARAPISAIAAAVPSASTVPATRRRRAPESAPSGHEQRAADRPATSAAGRVGRAEQPRPAFADEHGRARVKKSAAVCAASWWATTTTVRSASRSPASATTFARRAHGQQAPAEPLAPAGDVVGDRRRRRTRRRPARARGAPRQPGSGGQRASRPDGHQ